MELIVRLDSWFAERMIALECNADARAYIIGVLTKFKDASGDMSSASMVLSYADACKTGRFDAYQRMGDWSLWLGSVHPSVNNWDVVETIGQLSYLRCNSLMMGRWQVYAELGEKLPTIIKQTHHLLMDKR